MLDSTSIIVINNVKMPINASLKEAFSVARNRLAKLGVRARTEDMYIYRRSVDARNKSEVKFVYSVAVSTAGLNIGEDKLFGEDISLIGSQRFPDVVIGDTQLDAPPVIVGSGPAGLFAALILAENGYRPIVLERGGSVSERKTMYERFVREHILDKNTNIQFGAGGAGTFSDGKLVTRINDPLSSYVLNRFCEFGADEAIKYLAKPHIGTDVLSVIVDSMLARIEELGGRVQYHTCFLSANTRGGKVVSVFTDKGEIPAGALILAIGHSARDTYETLMSESFKIEAKPFSVGMRIEHLAEDIDRAMYGDFAGNEKLGHAEYNLSYDTKNRGVYTFCMCPGGEVVAAASEDGGVAVNGMSYNSRAGRNSNSAVLASIFCEDFGSDPRKAIELQRAIERAAYSSAGGGYAAPIVTVGDFLSDRATTEPGRITPTYMNGNNVKVVSPSLYLPDVVTSSIKNALGAFDKKIKGFAARDAVLTGAETRTSAPLRILRNNETRLALGYDNLYPAGEGAGYAGGITSAAIDGLKSALALMKAYKPVR